MVVNGHELVLPTAHRSLSHDNVHVHYKHRAAALVQALKIIPNYDRWALA